MDQDYKCSVPKDRMTLNQWLNSGLKGGKADKGQGLEKKVDFVNGKQIERTLTQEEILRSHLIQKIPNGTFACRPHQFAQVRPAHKSVRKEMAPHA